MGSLQSTTTRGVRSVNTFFAITTEGLVSVLSQIGWTSTKIYTGQRRGSALISGMIMSHAKWAKTMWRWRCGF